MERGPPGLQEGLDSLFSGCRTPKLRTQRTLGKERGAGHHPQSGQSSMAETEQPSRHLSLCTLPRHRHSTWQGLQALAARSLPLPSGRSLEGLQPGLHELGEDVTSPSRTTKGTFFRAGRWHQVQPISSTCVHHDRHDKDAHLITAGAGEAKRPLHPAQSK